MLFGDAPGPWILLFLVVIGALVTAIGFVEVGFSTAILRAVGVVAGFALQWCAVFIRRSHNPPKGSLVIGGDDE